MFLDEEKEEGVDPSEPQGDSVGTPKTDDVPA